MFAILNNGLHIEDGIFRYAWYHIQDETGSRYRCVALKQLDTLPVDDRDDANLLGKMWGAVRGLYDASVNFVAASIGIFQPEHKGVIQFFGAAGEGASRETAAVRALNGLAAVEGVMANFRQSRLVTPDEDWLRWYLEFVAQRGRFISVLLGHPDPREGRGGLSSADGAVDDRDDLAMEQNEILFRGLAKLRKNFVFQVLAEHVSRRQLTHALLDLSELASLVASRRKGSISIGLHLGIPLLAAVSQSVAGSRGGATGEAQGWAETKQHHWGENYQKGWAHTEATSSSRTEGTVITESHSQSVVDTNSGASTRSWGTTVSDSTTVSHSQGTHVEGSLNLSPADVGIKVGGGGSWTDTSGWSHGVARMEGGAETRGWAHAEGESDGMSVSHIVSNTFSKSRADTNSEARGVQEGWGEGVAASIARSRAISQAMMQGVSGGFSTGLVPGLSLTRSWQTEDDVADRLTEVLRKLEGLVNQAAAEGGFLSNALIFVEDMDALAAADALAPQAFHGPNVPTPVMTIAPLEGDEETLRAHALAFVPWRGGDDSDPLHGALWTRYATLLTASQVAALAAPALFEEGVAATVLAPIPPEMAFLPDMPGDVILGHQYSPETAELTSAQVRIAQENYMHTLYAGDTGYGKSVSAVRLVYETTLKWHWRTIVLDFGAGWRQLLNAPGLEGKVNILQLWPGAVRPMRWNPLQIGRNINPETQWRAFADVFGGISQLGVRRQKQELLMALRNVYLRAGVLVDDPEILRDPRWGKVQPDEADIAEAPPGTALADLLPAQRQMLAVRRSSVVGLSDLYGEVEAKLKATPPRDTMLTGVLDGILYRMNPLVQGAMSIQFAPGADTVPVEDLSKPWGVTIVEGGMFLDEFVKAFLLAWVGWHTYMDRVATRVHNVHQSEPILHIVYEEANKIFARQGGGDEEGGSSSIAEQYGAQFRDARKYGVRFSVIAQSPALLEPGIASSCSNLVVHFLKHPKDKDIILAALARSEKGFHDEPWRRFIDDIPIGMAIGRFPYTTERKFQRPILFRPLILDVPEPTDAEIEARLGRIAL